MNLTLWLINIFSAFSSFGAVIILFILFLRFKKIGLLFGFLGVISLAIVYTNGILRIDLTNDFKMLTVDDYLYRALLNAPTLIIETLFMLFVCLFFSLTSKFLIRDKKHNLFIILNSLFLIISSIVYYVFLNYMPDDRTRLIIITFIQQIPYITFIEYTVIILIVKKENIWEGLRKPLVLTAKIISYILIPLMLLEDFIFLFFNLSMYNLAEAFAFFILMLSIVVFGILFALKYPRIPAQYNSIEDFSRDVKLSSREEDVCILLIKALKYKEIADELSISIDTVKSHVKKIYQKSGIKSQQELRYKFSKK